jgi:hypothetical protein
MKMMECTQTGEVGSLQKDGAPQAPDSTVEGGWLQQIVVDRLAHGTCLWVNHEGPAASLGHNDAILH